MIPESTLQKILDNVSIVDIVSNYLTLESRGGRHWGCCPFHNEKTPSFSVSEEKKLFYCFGCHKGGSLFNFIMEIEGLPFTEAVKFIAEKAGISIDINQHENDREYKQKQALKELYSRVSKSFVYILWNTDEGKQALSYLRNRRITDDTIKEFQIGFAPADRKWLFNFLKGKGYSEGFLDTTGLFSKRTKGFPLFSDRIMIPIQSLQGDIVAFGGRIMSGNGPKYINSPETVLYSKREHLFGLFHSIRDIREKKAFFICEGYFDALAFHQAGIQNAVAPLGTALTPEQLRLLKRYTNKGFLVFDSDDAGFSATFKTLILSEGLGLNLEIIPIISGKDPAEILEKESEEALHKLVKYPINSFDYLLNSSIRKMDSSTPEGKESIVKRMLPFINAVGSSVRKEEYVKLLGEELDISAESIGAELRSQKGKERTRTYKKAESDGEKLPDLRTPELFLLIGVLSKPELFKNVRKVVALEDIMDSAAKKLFMSLEECYRRDTVSLDAVLNYIDDDVFKTAVLRRIASGEFSEHTEDLVKDAAVKVKINALKQRRDKIEKKLTQNEYNDSIKEILSEKMYLDGELDKLRLKQNDRSSE